MNEHHSASLTQAQKDRIAKNREEALKRQAEKRRIVESGKNSDGPSPDKIAKPQQSLQRQAIVNVPKAPAFPTTSGFSRSPLKNNNSDEPIKPNVAFTFQLITPERFKITFTPFHMSIVEVLKTIQSRHYDPQTRIWDLHLSDYELAKQKIKTLNTIRIKEINEIPDNVRKVFKESSYAPKPSTSTSVDATLGCAIDDSMLSRLFPYQKIGISFGVERKGCVIIADEMGLGKTVQALGIARYFKNEWPLLIICPSSVKYSWRAQIKFFLPSIEIGDIHIIEKSSDYIPRNRSVSTVVIMSYDQMNIKKKFLLENKFYVIIFDESHMLKDSKAQRTKVALELCKVATRRILISGTPALSRPAELYSQIKMVDPKMFPIWRGFASRYCDGKESFYGYEAKGATNTDELTAILQSRIMIRRLKKDVKDDLPPKLREIVWLDGKLIAPKMADLRKAKQACEKAFSSRDKNIQKQSLMEYYSETGIVKAPAVAEYVLEHYFPDESQQESKKVLIFAHHVVVLDTISIMLAKKGIKCIRIDGSTKSVDRETYCDRFQNDDDVLVALLSLTAAGLGINLTAASIVVFAELTWNPGAMVQAEDRAHRVGQENKVLVQYLLARNTADDDIWPLIQQKINLLEAVQISCEPLDKVSKETNATTASLGGRPEYPSIASYFKILDDKDEKDNELNW